MKHYFYTPDECFERIKNLFTPILNFWYIEEVTKRFEVENNSYRKSKEENKILAKKNHEDLLRLINLVPIEKGKYILLLLYEKIYYEMFNFIVDSNYDYYYLCNKFKELINL